jgi:hypothetical protein
MQVIANHPIHLNHYLLVAEISTGAPKAAIYRRRATICASIRRMLSQGPSQWNIESMVFLIAAAGSAENRMGNPVEAQIHHTAAYQLLKERGGLQIVHDMESVAGLGIVRCMLPRPLNMFPDVHALEEALQRFQLRRSSAIDYRLWPYLERSCRSRLHVANLHMLNAILFDPPLDFEQELVRLAVGGGPDLTPAGLQLIITTTAARTGGWTGQDKSLKTWESIEFVELIDLATIDQKDTVITCLFSWLKGDVEACIDVSGLLSSIRNGHRRYLGSRHFEHRI